MAGRDAEAATLAEAPDQPKQRLSFEAPSAVLGAATDAADNLFAAKDTSKAKNFKVVVRVRPPLEREEGEAPVVSVETTQVVSIAQPEGKGKTHTFVFDRVYDPTVRQLPLYESCIKPVVMSILEGYNGSIIAYGQTGTGKTHTVEGGEGQDRGIIPRSSEEVFNYIENSSDSQSKFLVRASFLQIYNEKIADLLDPDSLSKADKRHHMKIREDTSGGVYVDGLSEHIVKSPSEIVDLLKLGSTMRTTAQTDMNRESSRSHAVFTIIVEHSVYDPETDSHNVTIGKLNLVDLAGSERIRKTGVQGGKRLDELKNINQSLTAFGKVVLALTSPGNHHVPYRDSKLTRLLQGSLGGNCKTTMITAVTPCLSSYQETLNSLKFAKRAKHVKNFAMINQDLSEQALLSMYEKEIKRLRRELEANRRESLVAGDPLVDQSMLDTLKKQQQELAEEKDQIRGELERRSEEVRQHEDEKQTLRDKLQAMERQMLTGGAHIEDHPEFHAAVQSAEERLKKEYEERYSDLAKEREKLALEKAEFERQRTMFSMASGTSAGSANSTSSGDDRLEAGTESQTQPDGIRRHGSRSTFAQPQRFAKSITQSSMGSSGIEEEAEDFFDEEESDDEPLDEATQQALDAYNLALRNPDTGIPVHDRRQDFQYFRNVFTGIDAAEWFMSNMQGVHTLDMAQTIGQKFLDLNVFKNVEGAPSFDPTEKALYQFVTVNSRRSRPSSTRRPPSSRPRSSRPKSGRRSSFASQSDAHSAAPAEPAQAPQQAVAAPPAAAAAEKPGRKQRPKSARAVDTAENMLDEEYGATLLHSAAGQGDRSAMKTFLQSFPIDCKDEMGRTPLMYASIGNKSKAIELLLKQGANATYEDGNGRTALLWAAYYGHHDVIKVLLKHDKTLVDKVDPDGRTAVHWATKHDSTKSLDLLLKFCISKVLNVQDMEQVTALHWSVLCQHHEHCFRLLKAGADPRIADSEGRTAIHYAVSNTNPRCLKGLIENCDTDALNIRDVRGRAALHLSISSEGPLDIVACLLSHAKIDVNCTDVRMTTPLHWAAVCNRPDICKALAQRGAKLMFRDVNGMTALHYAIQKNHAECANLLQRLASSGDRKQPGPPSAPRRTGSARPQSALSRYLR